MASFALKTSLVGTHASYAGNFRGTRNFDGNLFTGGNSEPKTLVNLTDRVVSPLAIRRWWSNWQIQTSDAEACAQRRLRDSMEWDRNAPGALPGLLFGKPLLNKCWKALGRGIGDPRRLGVKFPTRFRP